MNNINKVVRQIYPNPIRSQVAKADIAKNLLRFPKNGNHMLDLDDEQAIVALEIDGYRTLWIEQDLVVLGKWNVFRVLDLGGDGDDSSGYRRNLDIVRQTDTALGLFFVLILANQDPLANRLDRFKR